MSKIIQTIGLLIMLAGILIMIDPDRLLDWIADNESQNWLYYGAIFGRLIIGILLIKSSSESRYPIIIKYLGYLFIIAVLIFIVIGQNHFQQLISYLIHNFRPYTPLSSFMALGFGGFLIYAFTPNRKST